MLAYRQISMVLKYIIQILEGGTLFGPENLPAYDALKLIETLRHLPSQDELSEFFLFELSPDMSYVLCDPAEAEDPMGFAQQWNFMTWMESRARVRSYLHLIECLRPLYLLKNELDLATGPETPPHLFFLQPLRALARAHDLWDAGIGLSLPDDLCLVHYYQRYRLLRWISEVLLILCPLLLPDEYGGQLGLVAEAILEADEDMGRRFEDDQLRELIPLP